MSILASCSDCQKKYRVPHARKAWNCKACGGALVLPEATGSEAPDCPECGEALDEGAEFCAACGHALGGDRTKAAQAEAKVAAAQMRKAQRKLKRINLPLVLGVSLAFGLLGMVGPLFRLADLTGLEITELSVQGGFCLLNLLGIMMVKRRPFLVTLALASLQTLRFVLVFLALAMADLLMEGLIPLALIGLFSVAYWCLVVWCARLERLAREFPDSYQARMLRGELDRKGVREEDSIANKNRAQSRGRSKGTFQRMAVVVAGLLLIATGGYFGVQAAGATPKPNATLESFLGAWNTHNPESIGAFFGEARASKWSNNVEKVQVKYEWQDRLPPLETFTTRMLSEQRVEATFQGRGGALILKFSYEDGAWRATSMDLRNVKDWRP